MVFYADGQRGNLSAMTDHMEDLERNEDNLERDTDRGQTDRAPAPGNTPAAGEQPLDSGAITGGKLADDH